MEKRNLKEIEKKIELIDIEIIETPSYLGRQIAFLLTSATIFISLSITAVIIGKTNQILLYGLPYFIGTVFLIVLIFLLVSNKSNNKLNELIKSKKELIKSKYKTK